MEEYQESFYHNWKLKITSSSILIPEKIKYLLSVEQFTILLQNNDVFFVSNQKWIINIKLIKKL